MKKVGRGFGLLGGLLVAGIAQAQTAKFAPPACAAPLKPRSVTEARGTSYFCVDAKSLKQGMVLRTLKFGDEERVMQRSQFKNDHEQSSVEYRYDAKGRVVVVREKSADGKVREGAAKHNDDQSLEMLISPEEGVQVTVFVNGQGEIKKLSGTQQARGARPMPLGAQDLAKYSSQIDRVRLLLTSPTDREPPGAPVSSISTTEAEETVAGAARAN